MLQIWIGRAGAGKSRRVLDTINRLRHEREQILLVPEHASHEAEMDLCRICGDTASANAEVLSFRTLAGRVLAQCGGLSDFTLDNGGKLLTMRMALQEVRSQLKLFGRPSQRSAFLQQLTELMDEFYAYEVSPERLYEQVSDVAGAAGEKLRDLALLFAAYDARLRSGGIDRRSRVQKLRDCIDNATYLVGKDVYLDGFSYFNAAEEHIVTAALRQSSSVTVTLLGDKSGEEFFQNALRQRDRLVRIARRSGVACRVEYMDSAMQGTLGHLERYMFGADMCWEQSTEGVEVYEAVNAYSEVEYVSCAIRRLVREKGCRYRDIAVSARNMDLYGPILENIFDRDGIPAYLSRRSDILGKPVLTMLLSALDAVTGGFEYEDMFRYLKTGMAGITPQECDLLENYVITWEIRGSMWLRDVDWTANPDGYGQEMTPLRQARLDEINRIRRRVRLALLQLSDGLKASETAEGKVKVLYEFAEAAHVPQTLEERARELLERGQVQLAREYSQLWQIFCGVLDQFVEILGASKLDGEEFARLLRLILSQYSVGTIPATLDQVKISDITRNDRHSVPYLFLLGANDHVLPQVDSGRGILDDTARRLLQQRDILLSDATFDRLDNELQNIYACLAQPTALLHVSYPITDAAGAELRPSFVVERIKKLLPALKVRREDGAYRMALPATALELAGEDPSGALWAYFAAAGSYSAELAAMERARAMGRGKLSPEAVHSLYGSVYRMSASRMDRLKSCHFSYFMEYGLRAKERKSAGFDAPEIGTFFHYLLENVTRDVMERGGYQALPQEELHALVERYVAEFVRREIGDLQAKSARFRYLFNRLRASAYSVMQNVAQELAVSDFKPVAFELGFGGAKGDLPAISIRQDGAELNVSGKVDRVDGWVHDGKLYLRVVDYKTGRKTLDLGDLKAGLGIQMLLYLFALQRDGERYFGQPVEPAGVLYFPARDVILRAERSISEEKREELLRRELRRSGMVLGEPEVLHAMEHSALESPCYLPLHIAKDGTLGGDIVSAAQLGKLSRYVDKLLHQIASELRQGNVDADPYSRGPQESACTYCPFASACFFDDAGGDKRRVLKKTEPEEFWTFVDRTLGEEVSHVPLSTD